MLQIFVFLILYSINDLMLVNCMKTQYGDYETFEREKFRNNIHTYYTMTLSSLSFNRACVCEENPRNGYKYLIVCYYSKPHDGKNYTIQDLFIKDDLQCINCLLQINTYRTDIPDGCDQQLQFPIKQYVSTVIYRYETTDRTFITADKTLVQNFSNMTQTGQATSYSKAVTETDQYTFGAALTLSAEVMVKLPFIGKANVGVSVTGSFSYSYSKTVTTTVTAPAQMVSLPAGTQTTLTYGLYRVTFNSDNLLEFSIDEKGDSRRTDPRRFEFFKERIESNSFFASLFPHPSRPGAMLTPGGEWRLKNIPAKEKLEGHELHIVYGTQDPVQGAPELGPNDRAITMG